MPTNHTTPLGHMLGEKTDGPLTGWPIIADGQGGTILASPTGTSYHRETSTLDSTSCWQAVDTFYASPIYKVFRSGYDEQRRLAREAQLATLRS